MERTKMRLKDADALFRSLSDWQYDEFVREGTDAEYDLIDKVLARVSAAPTIDAVPVVHGHYVGEYDGYADGNPVYDMWYCSECGYYFEDWDDKPTYNFCPNCGAKMDGERKDDES